MKLYAENLRGGQKSQHIFKTKGLITWKLLEVLIRKIPQCYRLHYWRIVENFLVCHEKIEGVYTKKVATEKHRFAPRKEA